MTDRTRGQIMLVGAIALAFVVLSLTVVYTAQLSARPASTGTAGVDAGNADEFNREARRNVRVLAVRANHREPYYADLAAVNDSVDGQVGNYSDLVSQTYAGRSGTVVAVDYEGVAPGGEGTRTVTRGNDTSFTNATGASDWEPVGGPSEVGWAVFNFNISRMGNGDSFEVVVENGTAPNTTTRTYTFTRNPTGESVLDLEVVQSGFTTSSATCNPIGSRLLFDLKSATTASGCLAAQGATLPGLSDLDGPYRVSFRNADAARGGFGVVTGRQVSNATNDLPECNAASPGDVCNTPVVWNATVTSEYHTDRLSYVNTQNVTVYEGV